MKSSFPPLLRGIGLSLILVAAVIAFYIAKDHDRSIRIASTPVQNLATQESRDSVTQLASEVRELRVELEKSDVVDKVIENTWFELVTFIGSALVAASFFVEAYLRRREDT